MNEEEYVYLKRKINNLLQIDLDGYKDQQMRRRLDAFIIRAQSPGVVAYCRMLESDKDACRKLRDFLTINVSEFFRDREQYEILRSRILPELLKRSPRLNIWSAGCSIGAEPYSVAILLEEIASYNRHRILATDIDVTILERAKAGGPYIASDVRNMDKYLLSKYFKVEENKYWIADKMRQKIEFKKHNLLMDPFEKGFDLIICRNVVIYFADEAKKQLYRKFYSSLKDNGVFFMGATETMLGVSDMKFEKICSSFHRKNERSEGYKSKSVRTAKSSETYTERGG